MTTPAHLGMEYSDLGFRLTVLADGRIYPFGTVMEQLAWFEPNGRVARPDDGHTEVELGVSFPGVFRMLGGPELLNAEQILRDILKALREAIEGKFGKRFARTTIAVPTALVGHRRSLLVAAAETVGFQGVELVDAEVPCAVVRSGGIGAPITQLVYYLTYGECEFALLRVVRGRVKVIDSGVFGRASGQLFDAQLMEEMLLALRDKNIFLGLNAFRARQWLEFRKIAAIARAELNQKPAVKLRLPPSVAGDGRQIDFTLSAAALAQQIAPAIRSSLDEVGILLERNEIKPGEIDTVIAVGDPATRYPAAGLLAQMFPGKVIVGNANTVSMAAAAYSAWVASEGVQVDKNLFSYFSSYKPETLPPVVPADGSAVPVVSVVNFKELVTATALDGVAAAGAQQSVDQAAGANDASPTVTVAAAKDLIERGRQLFDELAKIVERAEAEDSKPDAAAEESKSGAADDSGEPSGAAILMEQAEDMLSRGLYAEAVNLAHRAYAEASFDHDIFTAMLNVHVNAAALLDQQEKYADAIHLLMCAHSHDRTDRTVQRALAARHLQHARAMRGHDDAAAIEAVKEALRFDPKHPEAVAMFDELSGVQAGKAE